MKPLFLLHQESRDLPVGDLGRLDVEIPAPLRDRQIEHVGQFVDLGRFGRVGVQGQMPAAELADSGRGRSRVVDRQTGPRTVGPRRNRNGRGRCVFGRHQVGQRRPRRLGNANRLDGQLGRQRLAGNSGGRIRGGRIRWRDRRLRHGGARRFRSRTLGPRRSRTRRR